VEALWCAAGGRVKVREAQASALLCFAERMASYKYPQVLLEEWLEEHVVRV
jgi:hypothetical protein